MRGHSLHRRRLNRALRALEPLTGRVLEIGNGRTRRGIDLRATWTLDLDAARWPSIRADAHTLPLGNGELDGVICCETLQYCFWEMIALREMRRVLKVGGRLILSVPWSLKRESFNDRHRWNEGEIMNDLTHAGFTMLKVTRLECWLSEPSGLVVDAVAA